MFNKQKTKENQDSNETGKKTNLILASHPSPGLMQDKAVVKEIAETAGYKVQTIDIPLPFSRQDINLPIPSEWQEDTIVIMFEHIFGFSPEPAITAFYANPEWILDSDINKIEDYPPDYILAKSRDAEQRLQSQFPTCEVIYTGFSSLTSASDNVRLDFSKVFHARGLSGTKNTSSVLKSYEMYGEKLPYCTVTMRTFDNAVPEFDSMIGSNCRIIFRDLEQSEMDRLIETHGIHLCPSECEGFGHYIFGPMRLGNIVVTSDCPPMNELVTDTCGFLIRGNIEDRGLYQKISISPDAIAETLLDIMSKSPEGLKQISQNAQNRFNMLNDEFEQNFLDFIKKII